MSEPMTELDIAQIEGLRKLVVGGWSLKPKEGRALIATIERLSQKCEDLKNLLEAKSSSAARSPDREAGSGTAARPESEWHEDEGSSLLWWRFPVTEPPYIGSPLDEDFPDDVTHWTRYAVPDAPASSHPVPSEGGGE